MTVNRLVRCFSYFRDICYIISHMLLVHQFKHWFFLCRFSSLPNHTLNWLDGNVGINRCRYFDCPPLAVACLYHLVYNLFSALEYFIFSDITYHKLRIQLYFGKGAQCVCGLKKQGIVYFYLKCQKHAHKKKSILQRVADSSTADYSRDTLHPSQLKPSPGFRCWAFVNTEKVPKNSSHLSWCGRTIKLLS